MKHLNKLLLANFFFAFLFSQNLLCMQKNDSKKKNAAVESFRKMYFDKIHQDIELLKSKCVEPKENDSFAMKSKVLSLAEELADIINGDFGFDAITHSDISRVQIVGITIVNKSFLVH